LQMHTASGNKAGICSASKNKYRWAHWVFFDVTLLWKAQFKNRIQGTCSNGQQQPKSQDRRTNVDPNEMMVFRKNIFRNLTHPEHFIRGTHQISINKWQCPRKKCLFCFRASFVKHMIISKQRREDFVYWMSVKCLWAF
jgi:hypothetical protein